MNLVRQLATCTTLALGLATTGVASAEPVVILFEGEVTSIDDPKRITVGKIAIGQRIHGRYVYEAPSADLKPSPIHGQYRFNDPRHGMEMEIDGYVFQTDRISPVTYYKLGFDVFNDASQPGFPAIDSIRVSSTENVMDIPMPGSRESFMFVDLTDFTGTALGSDRLPSKAPDLGAWESTRLWISNGNPDDDDASNQYVIQGRVTRVHHCTGKACLSNSLSGAAH